MTHPNPQALHILDPGVPYGWGKIIWSSYLPSSKNLSFFLSTKIMNKCKAF